MTGWAKRRPTRNVTRWTLCLLAVLLAFSLTGCAGGKRRAPFITASPNPVPSGLGGTGTTVIAWNAGLDRPGRVMLTLGREEVLFALGGTGRVSVPWIGDNAEYEFRLYDERSNTLLAAVKVKRGDAPWRVYIIAIMVIVVLIGIAAAVMYGLRAAKLKRKPL